MDLCCIGYNNNEVFIYDLTLNNRFEVEAGRVLNFTEELYQSLDDYVDENITINEFLDDISLEYGIRPSLLMPSRNIKNECKDLPKNIRNKILDSMISIGRFNSPSMYIPIELCKYVI